MKRTTERELRTACRLRLRAMKHRKRAQRRDWDSTVRLAAALYAAGQEEVARNPEFATFLHTVRQQLGAADIQIDNGIATYDRIASALGQVLGVRP